jgi:YHS domain-containing protein
VRAFGEDPEQYVEARKVEVPCAVYPDKKAKLDPKLRARLNWEVFMFSSAKARAAFDREPLRYCGLLTDPVSQRRFQPLPQSPTLMHRDRRYYFESEATRATFASMPDSMCNRKGM